MITTANEEIIDRIKKALEEGPLYIKQISQKASVSPNTAGKYVDIMVQSGIVKVEPYASTKRVRLNDRRL
jgi:Mn-dependent DtxR family transcriptional regulator